MKVIKVSINVSMSNTSHVDFSRCLLLSQDTAVLADILRLDVLDVHLSSLPLQCHLIPSPMVELVLRLPPLHGHSGPGQLTAEGHVASFGGLLVLQTQLKGEGDSCRKNACCIVLFIFFMLASLLS